MRTDQAKKAKRIVTKTEEHRPTKKSTKYLVGSSCSPVRFKWKRNRIKLAHAKTLRTKLTTYSINFGFDSFSFTIFKSPSQYLW